jgi:hypothetical protein
MDPAFNILAELAERPCSIRLAEGDSWEDIEEELYGPYRKTSSPGDFGSEEEVRELVDLGGVVECANLDMWVEEVAANLGQEPHTIEEAVESLLASRKYRWSEAIGSLITTT